MGCKGRDTVFVLFSHAALSVRAVFGCVLFFDIHIVVTSVLIKM